MSPGKVLVDVDDGLWFTGLGDAKGLFAEGWAEKRLWVTTDGDWRGLERLRGLLLEDD